MPAHRRMSLALGTERLTLRAWADTDAADYLALVTERGDGVPSESEVRGRIATQRAAAATTGVALLAIHRRVEGDFIGYCGLTAGRATVEEPEIAYELLSRVHGEGYATEAARAVLAAAAATGRARLWAAVRVWNAPSFRVLEKLGFERDHLSTDDRGEIVWLTRTLP